MSKMSSKPTVESQQEHYDRVAASALGDKNLSGVSGAVEQVHFSPGVAYPKRRTLASVMNKRKDARFSTLMTYEATGWLTNCALMMLLPSKEDLSSVTPNGSEAVPKDRIQAVIDAPHDSAMKFVGHATHGKDLWLLGVTDAGKNVIVDAAYVKVVLDRYDPVEFESVMLPNNVRAIAMKHAGSRVAMVMEITDVDAVLDEPIRSSPLKPRRLD
jgi:hypothetical protein